MRARLPELLRTSKHFFFQKEISLKKPPRFYFPFEFPAAVILFIDGGTVYIVFVNNHSFFRIAFELYGKRRVDNIS